MPSFWSFISNGEYCVGCTGQTVYVYSADGTELARFKDLIYAYLPGFSPKGDIFVVKTTEGRLAVYSLDPLRLVKKFRYSKVDGAQDDNFCFSPDGELFYNIERHGDSCKTALSVYDTKDFSLKKRLFKERTDTVLDTIEYDGETDAYYLLGFVRDENGVADKFFVAKFYDDEINDVVYIPQGEYDDYSEYKHIESKGLTGKAKEWSGFKYRGVDLSTVDSMNLSLAELWQKKTNV